MLSKLDEFYLIQDEPLKSSFTTLRDLILAHDADITHAWKFNMPFFLYKGKMFCYIWMHTKLKQPFIGFNEGKLINHPKLMFENRSRVKIIIINPEEELPVDAIKEILGMAINLVKKDL